MGIHVCRMCLQKYNEYNVKDGLLLSQLLVSKILIYTLCYHKLIQKRKQINYAILLMMAASDSTRFPCFYSETTGPKFTHIPELQFEAQAQTQMKKLPRLRFFFCLDSMSNMHRIGCQKLPRIRCQQMPRLWV